MTTSCKWLLPVSTALFFHLSSIAPLPAASFGVNPSADAFVTTGPTGSLVNSNYGAGGGLALSAPTLSKGEFQSVLRFDLSGAKNSFDSLYGAGQWTIQSVALQLVTTAGGNPIFNTSAAGQFGVSWMQNDGWTEGTGSPNTPGSTGIMFSSLTNNFISGSDEGLGTFGFAGGTTGTNIYTLTLSSGLSSDVLAGDNLSLRFFAADSAVSYLFNSRDFGTATSRPLLTVSAVPEPAAVAFGAVALALFSCRKCLARTRRP